MDATARPFPLRYFNDALGDCQTGCDVSGDATTLAALKQWARQPWRDANYAAFRDRLEEIGAPAEALKTADDFRAWARKKRMAYVEGGTYRLNSPADAVTPGRERPTRTERLRFARLHWAPKLLLAFGPEEVIPF